MRIIYAYYLCVFFPTQKTAYKGTKAKLYCRYNINLLLADIICDGTLMVKKNSIFLLCVYSEV